MKVRVSVLSEQEIESVLTEKAAVCSLAMSGRTRR
jgi:hypothetical protein